MTSRPKKPARSKTKRPMLPTDRVAYSPIVEQPPPWAGAQIADRFVSVGPKAP